MQSDHEMSQLAVGRPVKLDPDGIPAYLKKQDEPVTDENRMRRLPSHTPVPDRARRERVIPRERQEVVEQVCIPRFLVRGFD